MFKNKKKNIKTLTSYNHNNSKSKHGSNGIDLIKSLLYVNFFGTFLVLKNLNILLYYARDYSIDF